MRKVQLANNQLAKTKWVKYSRQFDARQSTSWATRLVGNLRSTICTDIDTVRGLTEDDVDFPQ